MTSKCWNPQSLGVSEHPESIVLSASRNLLSPAGVQLQPATFWLKVYRAEDVPQMDTSTFQGIKKILGANEERKELVDPYLGFYFAGKKVKTKVITECNHPEWNQELKLGIKVFLDNWNCSILFLTNFNGF